MKNQGMKQNKGWKKAIKSENDMDNKKLKHDFRRIKQNELLEIMKEKEKQQPRTKRQVADTPKNTLKSDRKTGKRGKKLERNKSLKKLEIVQINMDKDIEVKNPQISPQTGENVDKLKEQPAADNKKQRQILGEQKIDNGQIKEKGNKMSKGEIRKQVIDDRKKDEQNQKMVKHKRNIGQKEEITLRQQIKIEINDNLPAEPHQKLTGNQIGHRRTQSILALEQIYFRSNQKMQFN